jgi:hypothetical protein
VASSASTVALRTTAEFIDCQFENQRFEGDATAPGVVAYIGSSGTEEVIFQKCGFSSNAGGVIGLAWDARRRRMQDEEQPPVEMPIITLANSSVANISASLEEVLEQTNKCRDSNGDPITPGSVQVPGLEDSQDMMPDEPGFAHGAFCEKGYGCDDSAPTDGLQCKPCEKDQHSNDGKLCRPCEPDKHSLPMSTECTSTNLCDLDEWYDHAQVNINKRARCIACPPGAICESGDEREFMSLVNEPGYWLNFDTMVPFACPYDDRDLCVACDVSTSLESPILPRPEYDAEHAVKSSGQLFDDMDADENDYLERAELDSGLAVLGSVFAGAADDVNILWIECGPGDVDVGTAGEPRSKQAVKRQDFVDRMTLYSKLSADPLVVATCCRRGHAGVLCASCQAGWVKAKGVCIPCAKFHHWRLAGVLLLYGVLVMAYWFKAWRLKMPLHVDEQCQSAAVVLLVFFFQTAMLLDIDFIPGNLSIDILNMDLDSPTSDSGMCLSSGDFYCPRPPRAVRCPQRFP